jgi:AcrR family transcriptional regulator
MRSHGWSGNTPASDEEAIARILAAADRIVADRGAAVRIADVARDLGVTRQTVYRYFPSTEALLIACALQQADGFLDRLEQRVRDETDHVAALVEGLAFCIEELSGDTRIGLALDGGSVSSDTAQAFGRSMLRRFGIDWAGIGFDDEAVSELNEFMLRLLNSYFVDPGPRHGVPLREYLRRWLGPALTAPAQRVSAASRRRRP